MTAQIYGFYWTRLALGELQEFKDSPLFTYNLNYAIVGCLLVTLLNELWRGWNCVRLLIIVAHICLLTALGALDESYWTIFLGVQVVFCNFVSDLVSRRFEISFLEMFVIGMCFFDVFAYHSLHELLEVLMDSHYNGS